MNNLKNAVWNIKRHLDELLNFQDEKQMKYELFHPQSSVDCLSRVMDDEKPYPFLYREEVF